MLIELVRDQDRRANLYYILAAVDTQANLKIVRMVGGDECQVFMVDNLISRLITQTCRQSGLSVVYGELFSFEGAAIYFLEEPGLVGITYGEALFRFPNATLIGLQYQDGRVQLSPPTEAAVRAGDKVIVIAKGGTVISPSNAGNDGVDSEAIRDQPSSPPAVERLLILGWNRRGPLILEQLDYYMPLDSEVLVLAPVEPQQMQADAAVPRYQRMQVTF